MDLGHCSLLKTKFSAIEESICTANKSERIGYGPLTAPYLRTYLLTYLLTPWSRVLLEKLTVNFAASQEIPRI
jgi:hypothetical protein